MRGPQRVTTAVPGVALLASYARGAVKPDLVAGLTLWATLVPQSVGFAALAGLPPVTGLYAALGAMLLYWLWGSSRELNLGPESAVAILMATALAPIATPRSDEYVALAVTLALLVGLMLVIGGLLRLGRAADFLARPVLAGYVFGSGVIIISSQLARLFGVNAPASLHLTELGALLGSIDQTNLSALAIGLGSIVAILLLRRAAPRVPAPLVALAAASVLVLMTGAGVELVGAFPTGLPPVGLPEVTLEDVGRLVGPAFAIALLVYPDSLLTAKSLALGGRYRLNPDREFFAVGAANLGSGLLGGFPVNGSQSRSFVLRDSGARTQVANLWAAAFVVLTLVLLAPAFGYVPAAALAGVVIVAGFRLLTVAEFRLLWRLRRSEFWLAALTAAAVLGLGMLVGILVAVGLSLLQMVVRAANPHTAILGRLPDTDTYRALADHPDAEATPGLLVYRFDAPLFFANAGRLRDDILGYVDDAEEPVQRVVLDAELVFDIDSTAVRVLRELLGSLDDRGVTLSLARVRTEIRDELASAGITPLLAGEGIYLEVDDVVADDRSERRDHPISGP